MPSFTFVSTANAFALRGATVVFADICPQTLNLDPVAVANAITPRTRAIVPVHYAGVPCDMQPIMALSRKYNIAVVEDAAQAIGSRYQGKPVGSFGQLAAVSFHETKNLTSGGEGGALLINDASLADRAEILREKGTNRAAFFRGHVDKYSWVDVGSSLLPSELQSAYLLAQLEARSIILSDRRRVWDAYKSRLASSVPFLRSPTVPETVEHNGHIYHVRVDSLAKRTLLLDRLNKSGIHAVFHYVPLHSAPAAKQRSRFAGTDVHTTTESERLIRLPLWFGMSDVDIERVCETLERSCSDLGEIAENR